MTFIICAAERLSRKFPDSSVKTMKAQPEDTVSGETMPVNSVSPAQFLHAAGLRGQGFR